MSINVYIAATLKGFADKNNQISAEGNTVEQVLKDIKDEYPELGRVLFSEEGHVRDFINIYLRNTDVTDKLITSVRDTDEIFIIPAMAGGSGEKEPDNAGTQSVISDERRKEISFGDPEIERFNKHLMLKEIGVKGQKRIKASKVLVIGLGSLGSPVVSYLAAAGVGTLGIADHRKIDPGDIICQTLHTSRDIKRPRTASAKDKIRNIDKSINVEVYDGEITPDNILDIVSGYDVVCDCSDSYRMRYMINDACAQVSVPDVYASVYQFEAQVSVFDAANGPCFRCLYPAPPPGGLVPTCAESGILSPLAGVAGSIQAAEALKLIVGGASTLTGKVLYFDLWNLSGRVLTIHEKPDCPVCGSGRGLIDVGDYDYDEFCGLKAHDDEIPVEGISAEDLIARIDRGDDITIVDVREPHERAIHRFPDAVVIPIGQLARRQKELDPTHDTIFICREGKRSILAINTLREAGYTGPMYSLTGGIEATKNIIFANEGAWL